LEPADAVTQGVQATSTARHPDRERANQRIDRVRLCRGKITGTYVVQLTGGWTTRTDRSISTETASRNCYNFDPEGGSTLVCDSWQWSYFDNTDSSDVWSDFTPQSMTIEVAAVPEPATTAMLALGLVVLALVARRRGQRHGHDARLASAGS
ncbi:MULTISPECIES: PEP-CTERM sorting domain-containing protein, partial [unclassified Roseateles]|uniref:PEP-CTERM sorting domain-containing protein n=1 Tax=unclassified Roseateles TaxID=2626991 RepID=UPI0012E36A52